LPQHLLYNISTSIGVTNTEPSEGLLMVPLANVF